MKRFLWIAMLLAVTGSLIGRLMEVVSYEEMFGKADLVVIAKPLSTKDTVERTTLPGDLHVVGVNTEFETRLVLKGDKGANKFVLHHYRLANPDEPIVNGPVLATFDPKEPKAYLLFLIKETDGRYAPASGQVDPAASSVIRLEGIAE
jgi:hypothetical protein